MSRNRLEPPSVNQIRSETQTSNPKYFFNPDIPVQKRSTSDTNLATPTLPGLKENRSRSPALIRLHVKLGPNNTKEVKCSLDDDPEVLAERFCADNGLQLNLVPVITKMLQDQFSQISQRRSVTGSPGRTQEQDSIQNNLKKDEGSRGRRSVEKQQNSERGNGSGGRSRKDESDIIRIIDKPKLILKLNVNVGTDQSKQLLLFEDQDPAEVAYWFCNENNLSLSLVDVLAKQMFQAKEQYQRSAPSRKSPPRQYFQQKKNIDQSVTNLSDVATQGGSRARGRDPTPVGSKNAIVNQRSANTLPGEIRSYEDFSVYSDKANPGSRINNIDPTPPASLTYLQPQGIQGNQYNNEYNSRTDRQRESTPPASLNHLQPKKDTFEFVDYPPSNPNTNKVLRDPTPPASRNFLQPYPTNQAERSEYSDNNSMSSRPRGRVKIFDDNNQNPSRMREPTPGGSFSTTQHFAQPQSAPFEDSAKASQQSSKKVIKDFTPLDSVNFLHPFVAQPREKSEHHSDRYSQHSSRGLTPDQNRRMSPNGPASRNEFEAGKVPSKNNLRDDDMYDQRSRSRSSHREVSPDRTLDNMIPSKYIMKESNDDYVRFSTKGNENDDEGARNSAKVEAYEKWTNLINEKRKVQQKKPGASFSPVRNTRYNNQPTRARSKSPVKIYNSAETNMAFVKSLRDDKIPKQPIYEEIRPSRDQLESLERKKMKAAEASQLTNRLHADAKIKRAVQQELDSFSRGTRPITDSSTTFNYRTSVSKSPKEIFKQQFVEGYVPGPRKRKEIERYEQYVKQNFTFKPTISPNSRILAERRDRSFSPIHDKLHAEAVINKSNRNLLTQIGFEENHPFKPTIGVYKSTSNNNGGGLSVETDFLDRMTQREKTKLKKLKEDLREKKEKELHTPRDPVTGQKLFQPLIKKNKYYQMLREQDEERKRKQKEQKERSKVFNSEVLKDADKGLQGNKTLRRIFDKLDDDKDGFISEKHIQLSELDAKTLEALINIFDIIEERKLKLNYFNFVRLIQNELTAEEKDMLELNDDDGSQSASALAESRVKDMEKNFRKDEISYLSKYGIKSSRTNKTPSPDRRIITASDQEKVTSNNLTKHYQKLIAGGVGGGSKKY